MSDQEGLRYTFTVTSDVESDLECYARAEQTKRFLFELRHNFWRTWKHTDLTDEQYAMKEEVLGKLFELMNEWRIQDDEDF